jgi:outer membrane protein assembly factor BamB
MRKAFATPHVAWFNGQALWISQGAKAIYAYDPLDGTEWWRVEERLNHSASSRPVVGHGLIYVTSGWATGQLLALRPGGKGEVLDANEGNGDEVGPDGLAVMWKVRRSVPRKPSLILEGDLLFGIDDGGIASCWEARTGKEVWRERVGVTIRHRRFGGRPGLLLQRGRKDHRDRGGTRSSRNWRRTN